MNLLILNGTVVTMDKGKTIHDGAVAVEGQRIVEVGKARELRAKYRRGYERIEGTGSVIIPGLINTHQHAAMSLLRGYADDLPLQEWLEKWIWPIERHMTPNDIYAGALLTAVESIMSGVTTVNTMYHYTPEANEAKAFADAHLRGVIGHVCFSWRKKEDTKALRDLAGKWHNKAEGLIRTSVDPHAPYTVDPEYMKELKEVNTELNEKYSSGKGAIILHMHIAETDDELRKTREAFKIPTRYLKHGIMNYLDSLGVLNEYVVAAHCVALKNQDIATMKRRKVKVSHNPISNLKLASGVSPVPKMLEKGITVSLGTDSPCSNNTADMFDVIKTAALLHKGVEENPTLMPAQQVMEMATIDGARALSWGDEIGSIETGKKADLVLINLRKPHLCPLYNEISHLVYATKPADVETVIINGDIVMENRQLAGLKVERVMEMAEKARHSLLRRLA